MTVRVLLLLVGVLHLANGATMLVAPMSWYAAVPGVVGTGPFNHHFILDVGMAFIASGGLLTLGARANSSAASFAIAGASWPILHALIHVTGWLTSGFPSAPPAIFSEVVGVAALAVLGGVLAWFRTKGEPT
jgi:hypothetical protein